MKMGSKATTSSYSSTEGQSILLRRLPSVVSSKDAYSVLSNPFSDENETRSLDDRSSINHSLLSHHNNIQAWNPTSTLRIDSTGKPPVSLPTPVSQLEIPIFSHTDGSLAYLSIRPERRSGSCALFAAEDGVSGTELASTKYVWGPGRDPVVRINGNEDIDEESFDIWKKSIWNRTHGFTSQKWGNFEWRYASKSERNIVDPSKSINSLLVLEKVLSGKGGKDMKVRVAMLIRGEGTRTEGTRASDAGNGGILEICDSGVIVGGERGETTEKIIDEVTVLVTCLVMLKKEIDRARAGQIILISRSL